MPVHFILKRHLPGFEEYGDLYEAIKEGRKTVEYRDATPYWAKRLLSEEGLSRYNEELEYNKDKARPFLALYRFTGEQLRHTEATFRVGYTRGPTLRATILDIVWHLLTEQFEIRIADVREEP